MIYSVLGMALSFAVTAALGPIIIPYLIRLKFGQSIKDIGPSWHKNKNGTPTMGGIMFIAGITAAVVLLVSFGTGEKDYRTAATLVACLVFGLIGFIDDFVKVIKKRNLGLTAIQKLILQFLTAGGYLVFLASNNYISASVQIPFTDNFVNLGWLYYIISVVVIVFVVNSVNLTDGIDGLAASVTIPVFIAITAMCLNIGAQGLSILSGAVIGGCAGFLVYNFHPAKIFMGDTGSLFLGGLVATLPFAMNIPFLVLFIGFVYICEALSVVLQVASFKLTGKRIFKMSPIHHHFELCKWSEVKIVFVFTAVAAAFSIVGYIAF